MQWLLAKERKKISTIVGDKRILPLGDDRQQLPVFETSKAQVVDMIGDVT